MLFLNQKGVIHVAGAVVIAILALAILPGLLKDKAGIDLSNSMPELADGQKQAELVRKTAHKLIDVQASLMKAEVDMAIEIWESAPPERKKQIQDLILQKIKNMKVPDFKELQNKETAWTR